MQAENRSVDVGRLKTLAEKVNTKHRRFQNAERRAVNYAAEAGTLLREVKEAVGHGNFIKWVEENFEGSPRHARRYTKLAKAVAEGRIDLDSVSSLAEAESLLRDQDAEPAPEVYEPEVEDGEFEPELPNEEYLFKDEEEFKKWGGEREPDKPDAESEPSPQTPEGPSPSKKKDVDPLRNALNAIGRVLGAAADDEQRAEWAQILHDEIDLFTGSFEEAA